MSPKTGHPSAHSFLNVQGIKKEKVMRNTHKFVFALLLSWLGFSDESNVKADVIASKTASTRSQITDIVKAINIYAMEHSDKLPDSLDVLVESDDSLLGKEFLLDSWGEPIGYEHNGHGFVLKSSGPDRKMGTADDIIRGWPKSYEERWKARHTQPVGGQGTNAVQQVTTGTVQPLVQGGTSPSQVKGGGAEKDGAVPPPSRLWLYATIALCVLLGGIAIAWPYCRKGR